MALHPRLRPAPRPDSQHVPAVAPSCSDNNSQWRAEPLADGAVRLVARHSGKALDLDACNLADGTTIQQWAWLDNICQRFHLRPV